MWLQLTTLDLNSFILIKYNVGPLELSLCCSDFHLLTHKFLTARNRIKFWRTRFCVSAQVPRWLSRTWFYCGGLTCYRIAEVIKKRRLSKSTLICEVNIRLKLKHEWSSDEIKGLFQEGVELYYTGGCGYSVVNSLFTCFCKRVRRT